MHPQSQTTGIPWRRIFAPISIIATILYLVFFTIEFAHAVHEKFLHEPPPPYTVTMKKSVANQLNQIRSVDTFLLARTVIDDLYAYKCKWYFSCSPIPPPVIPDVAFDPKCPACYLVATRGGPLPDVPRLTYNVGGLPIPTLHSVFGAPHAIHKASVKIIAAGPWAIIMFISCTIIYFSAALLWNSKSESTPILIVLIVITGSPVGISLLANIFQWAATKAFDGISWMLTPLITIIAYSSAVSLAVAVPHVWKAPREIAEAVDLIRKA